MSGAAIISDCGTYRYQLSRQVGAGDRVCLFVMLNPSTADAEKDDPTIRRCKHFAAREGCGVLRVVNLFAFRATDPADLRKTEAPIGPENDGHLVGCAKAAAVVVAAWGAHGSYRNRAQNVTRRFREIGINLRCLGTTKDGSPRHPLYVRSDQPLIAFGASA